MPKYSQNFLTNIAISRDIVAALEDISGDALVEIGPGRGALTRLIAEKGKPFTAVEIDPDMVARLSYMQDVTKVCKIVQADFMEADMAGFLPPDTGVKFVGNLPYDVGTAMVQRVLAWPKFESAVFMLQLEVVERIIAKPDTGKYGLLALSVQSRATPRLLFMVDKENFKPVPKVDSAVVELRRLDKPLFENAAQEKAFFKVARAAFAHRRKTILNSLSMALCKTKAEVEPLLKAADINPLCRPETLPLQKFLQLAAVMNPTV